MSADTPLAAGAVNIAPSPTVSQAKHTMTQRHTLSVSTPAKDAQPAPRIAHPLPWCGSLALVALLLSACASTPLPPWPGTPTAARSTTADSMPRVQRGVVVPAPLGQVRDNVVVTPLQVGAPTPAAPESAAAAPYGPAVAARFAEPSTQYSTPGLAPERRGFTTNSELGQWLHNIAKAAPRGPTQASVLQLGASQQGEPILGLLLTRAKGMDMASLEANGRSTVVLIGQQHGDEPAGSEALLVVARELAQGLLEPLLDRINVVVIPRANPDGATNGNRTTANGVDMNRDHLLLNTPEARALARVVRDYRPILVLDAHEFTVAGRYLQKFNAIQRYDALLQYTTTANYHEFLTKASQEWYHQPMLGALQSQGMSSEWYYTTSTQPDDKRISMGGVQPDTGRNVNGLKNAVSLLVETRGVGLGRLHIQRRVHTQVTTITSALRSTAERAADLEQVRSYVARDTASKACKGQVVIEAQATPMQRELTMLDPDTGADRTLKVDWNSSLALRPVKSRPRPCGYWLAAHATAAVERLQMLGVQVLRIAEPGALLADTYHETARETTERTDVRGTIAGGSSIIRTQVTPVRSAIDVPAGSFYVPLNQGLAHLAVAALEPDTQSSYFANRLIDELGSTARVMTVPSLVFEESDE